jgi:F0F1-type ATP synthase assembly protein I
MNPEARDAMRAAGRVSAIGIEFAAAVIVCLLIGYWADGKLGTSPWLAVAGIILGSGIGFRAVYGAAKTMQRQAEAENEKELKEDPDRPGDER